MMQKRRVLLVLIGWLMVWVVLVVAALPIVYILGINPYSWSLDMAPVIFVSATVYLFPVAFGIAFAFDVLIAATMKVFEDDRHQ